MKLQAKGLLAAVAPLVIAVSSAALPQQVVNGAEASVLSPKPWVTPAHVTIPTDTIAMVQLLSGFHSAVNQVNDPVVAELTRPLVINGTVALPTGSLFNGRITRVQQASRMGHGAGLGLSFEQVTLPDGEVQPVHAVLASMPGRYRVDGEGNLRAPGTLVWKTVAGGAFFAAAFVTAGAVVAAKTAAWALVPAAVSGVLGYKFLWQRGQDVNVAPHTKCRIRFDYPASVRVGW